MAAHGQTPPAGRVRLGELLVKAGVITDLQLKTALAEQKQWGGKLGDILVRMRYLSEDIFVRALSKQLGLPRADLSGAIPLEALARVPGDIAEEYEVVPVALLDEGKTLAIATSDPLNVTVLDTVRSIAKCRVTPYVAGASAIRAAVGRLYRSEDLRGDDGGQLQILANSVDEVPNAGSPARTQPTVSQRPSHTTGSGLRPVQQPAPFPPAQPSTHSTQPYANPYQAQPTPLPGQFVAPLPPPVPQPVAQLIAQPIAQPIAQMPAQPQPVAQPQQHWPAMTDERREVLALRALVELLVQKGVITLDEYLARLKR